MNTEYNPISWKRLFKNAIPKPIVIETRSYSRMHRRTISSMAMGGGAIKAGTRTSSESSKSLLLLIDSSPSMNIDYNELLNDILRIFRRNDISGIQDFYIVMFNSTYSVYKINFSNSRQFTFQEFENKEDILGKLSRVKLKEKKPIQKLFEIERTVGGFISVDIFKIMEHILKTKEFHQVVFSDLDLIYGENMDNLQKVILKIGREKNVFNIIFDDIFVTRTFNELVGWRCKDISCINR